MVDKAKYRDAQHIFNRQINYTIIRRLWKFIKGSVESIHPQDNLYDVLPFTRNAYTLLVTGSTYQTPNINQTRKRKLEETGVSIEVFTGDVVLTLTSITREEWALYFKYRYPDGNFQFEEFQKNDALRNMNTRLLSEFQSIQKYQHDSDIFKLYYYICNGKKYDGDEARYVLEDCIDIFSRLSFEQWDLLNEIQLEKYEEIIEKQLNMVKTLHSYKKYKGEISS